MNAITLGPLVLSGERFAMIAGVFVFMIGAGLLASRVSPRFNLWSTVLVFGGLAAARLGHVATHWEYFGADPWRALAVWQGGFSWIWVAPVVILATILLLRTTRERAWAIAPVLASALVWTTAHQLASATQPMAPPALTLAAMDAPAIDLSAPIDRPTVINLWATWCPPCRREMPTLMQTAKERTDIAFVLANQGEGAGAITRFLGTAGLAADHVALDQEMALARHYGVQGFPVTLFLDRRGILQNMHFGEISPEALNAAIDALQE